MRARSGTRIKVRVVYDDMTHMRTSAVIVAGLCCAALLGLGLGRQSNAAAVAATRSATAAVSAVHPTSGPPGTTVTVHGSGCPQPGWGDYSWRVHVGTGAAGTTRVPSSVTPPSGEPKTPIAFTDQGYPGRVEVEVTPGRKGRWVAHLTIPTKGHSVFPATPGKYPVGALCYAMEGAEAGQVNYNLGTFTVTSPPRRNR